ncbi:MAG: copper-binding protein [Oxalobacteraceae bacterium]|nr:copper-binding protein [Oxalobacteraceae bacterium]
MNAMFKAGSSLVLACALAQPVFAAESEPVTETAKKGALVPAEPVWSEGIAKKVDKTTGKLTIAHGAIKNLGMGPMTMMFRVKDPAMLEQVQAGQKIRFHIDIVNGAYTVLRIEPAK